MSTTTAFLLTATGGDYNGRFEITLHARATTGQAVRIRVTDFRPPFFVPRSAPEELTSGAAERRPLPLRTLVGEEVDCLYFTTFKALQDTAQRIRGGGGRVLESDVYPAERFLMERQVKGGMEIEGTGVQHGKLLDFVNPRIRGVDVSVSLSVLSLDIETHAATSHIYSIGCSGRTDRVFMVGEGVSVPGVGFCADEATMLRAFLAHVADEDPDVIIGWHVVEFDLTVIRNRCTELGVPFALGRDGRARILPHDPVRKRPAAARVPGRVVLDGPVMLRAGFHSFEEYSLDFVAAELLGKHKLITRSGPEKIAEIDRLFAHDKPALARYNLEDTHLTRQVFDATSILPDAIERSKLSGHLLDRVGGSVAAFDYLYLPLLHRAGRVAGDVADVPPPMQPLPGGYVMDSRPGIHENVLLFDFRSLYPSIIMTFMVDPLGMASRSENRVKGPVGPGFARDESILPSIISGLLDARQRAKSAKNAPLSQAIKIIMNSFYGVLGTPGCRFFSYDLSTAITGTGQYLLRQTTEHIQSVAGCPVIYGDTDSLFVLLGPGAEARAQQRGREIVAEVNTWLTQEMKSRFDAASALLLQFESHFRYFFMPAIRGTTMGSKKRYCGALEKPDGSLDLIFKGLESARTDWTELARNLQQELCMRAFTRQPVESYVADIVARVKSGQLDDKLVYKKRINKPLSEYITSIPPHVQAAKMLDSPRHHIAYVITKRGPQPIEKRNAPLDYDHYIEAQIRPIADSILEWVGTSLDRIVSGQQELFG
jgi:DNA polymerase-2